MFSNIADLLMLRFYIEIQKKKGVEYANIRLEDVIDLYNNNLLSYNGIGVLGHKIFDASIKEPQYKNRTITINFKFKDGKEEYTEKYDVTIFPKTISNNGFQVVKRPTDPKWHISSEWATLSILNIAHQSKQWKMFNADAYRTIIHPYTPMGYGLMNDPIVFVFAPYNPSGLTSVGPNPLQGPINTHRLIRKVL